MTLPAFTWTSDETLSCRWERHAEQHPDRQAVGVYRAGERTAWWTWSRLVEAAHGYAEWLQRAGVRAGDTCAIVSRHHEQFYPLYLGIVRLGAIPSVLAYPNARLHPDKFRSGLQGMARQSGLNWLLTERDLEGVVAELASFVRGVLFPYDASVSTAGTMGAAPPSDANVTAILQHSSGTTGLQKAVALSHRAVLEHVARYGDALQLNEHDRIVSWLPLYHDMGLIAAFHLPLALGIPTLHLDPFEWVQAPVLLIEALSQERGTLCWQPNFAYALIGSRVYGEDLDGLSLAHVRMLINCSEPVRADSQSSLLQKLAPIGLRDTALGASYAMAETTFAVTQTAAGRAASTLRLSRAHLVAGAAREAGANEAAVVCVSSGVPITGCEVRALDASGAEVADRQVGELWVRSVSLFEGYRNRPDLTRAVLRDGWYSTGDLGFRSDGEWYVVGRKKDLIIVAGKNLYPEDIEHAVTQVEGAIPGRAVAFGREDAGTGTEHVCVVLETALEDHLHEQLRGRVIAAVQQIDITLSELFLVPPRWLIKSSAGKLSRAANRERVLAEFSPQEVS